MGSSAIERLSDADLWEQLVAQGMPPDQATEQVQFRSLAPKAAQQTRNATPYSGKKEVGHLKGAPVAAGQGLTAGFLDELGGILAGLDLSTVQPGQASVPVIDPLKYEATRDAIRDTDARYAENHPIAHFAAETAGAIPTALALPGGPVAGAALYGGASGAGHADGGLVDRAGGAAMGAASGALLGKSIESGIAPLIRENIAPLVRKGAQRAGGALQKLLLDTSPVDRGPVPFDREMAVRTLSGGPRIAPDAAPGELPLRGEARLPSAPQAAAMPALDIAPETPSFDPAQERAAQLLLKRLVSDKRSVGNLLEDAAGRPIEEPVTVMELGGHNQNVRGLARGARTIPSKAKTEIPEALYDRLQQEPVLARNALEGAAGERAGDPALMAKELAEGQRASANVNYGKAYSEPPITDPDVLSIFSDPGVKTAYKIAARQAARDGVKLPPLDKATTEPMPMQGFDYIKRGLDDYIESRMSAGKMGRNEARQLRNMLSGALEKVDQARPEYAKARAEFGEGARQQEMVDLGQQALDMDDRELGRLVAGLKESERPIFTKSWLDAAAKKIRETGDTQDVYRRLFGNQLKRDTFKALLGDQYSKVEQAFARGSERVATKQTVLGGSNTVDKASEALDIEGGGIPDALMKLLTMRPGAAAKSLGQSVLLNRLQGISGETADALSPMLTAGAKGGPESRAALMKLLTNLNELELKQAAKRAAAQRTAKYAKPVAGSVASQQQKR